MGTISIKDIRGREEDEQSQGISINDIRGRQQIGPTNAPVATFGEVSSSPSGMPSAGTLAVSSLPTDELTRVKYLAKEIFPNRSWEDVSNRFSYVGDRLAYQDDHGNSQYVDPKMRWPTSLENIKEAGKAIASSLGPAMPPVGGAIGGMATMGFGGGVPGAMGGGAVADMARQGLAAGLTGEEKTPTERALQTGGAALQEGVSQGLGLGVTKMLGRFGRTPMYDIPATNALKQKADTLGIPLTAAEATGSRELIRRQKVLQNTTGADETFENFYKGRNEKVGQAVYTLLDQISKVPSVRGASASGVQGALEAAKTARAKMQAQAKPWYDEALQGTNLVDLRNMDQTNRQIVEYAVNKAKQDPVYGPELRGVMPNSMPALHEAKQYIDDLIGKAKVAGERNRVRLLTNAQNDLLKMMDDQVPQYKVARGIYSDMMPKVSEVERGIVGDAAALENNDVMRAPQIIFGKGSSGQDVKAAYQAFKEAGQDVAWNDLVRSHLQNVFETIPDSANGSVVNIGGTYRKALYGTPQRREIINAALEGSPQARENLQWMMDVLEASGKAMKGESITAFAQMGQKELAQEAKGLGPKLIETIEIWKTPSRVGQWWADVQTGKYAAKMAQLLTDPDSLTKMRELRKLSPTSAGAVIGLSHLLVNEGAQAAEDAMTTKDQKRLQQGRP